MALRVCKTLAEVLYASSVAGSSPIWPQDSVAPGSQNITATLGNSGGVNLPSERPATSGSNGRRKSVPIPRAVLHRIPAYTLAVDFVGDVVIKSRPYDKSTYGPMKAVKAHYSIGDRHVNGFKFSPKKKHNKNPNHDTILENGTVSENDIVGHVVESAEGHVERPIVRFPGTVVTAEPPHALVSQESESPTPTSTVEPTTDMEIDASEIDASENDMIVTAHVDTSEIVPPNVVSDIEHDACQPDSKASSVMSEETFKSSEESTSGSIKITIPAMKNLIKKPAQPIQPIVLPATSLSSSPSSSKARSRRSTTQSPQRRATRNRSQECASCSAAPASTVSFSPSQKTMFCDACSKRYDEMGFKCNTCDWVPMLKEELNKRFCKRCSGTWLKRQL